MPCYWLIEPHNTRKYDDEHAFSSHLWFDCSVLLIHSVHARSMMHRNRLSSPIVPDPLYAQIMQLSNPFETIWLKSTPGGMTRSTIWTAWTELKDPSAPSPSLHRPARTRASTLSKFKFGVVFGVFHFKIRRDWKATVRKIHLTTSLHAPFMPQCRHLRRVLFPNLVFNDYICLMLSIFH